MLPQNFRDSHICIIGLGYVGLTLAVAMADAGFTVHGVERDQNVLKCLGQKRAHFSENGLNERLAVQIERKRFTFSEKLTPEIQATAFIVTVGTPIGADKRTRADALETVVGDICKVLKDDDLVILRSTVKVNTTTEVVKPLLEATGKSYDLAFCPERTLEGKALAELRTLPQIVGGVTAHSTFRASQMFSLLTPSIIRVRDPETAEMTKLVNNTQRDFLFAFANEVADLCDALGISAHEVISSGNVGYPRANMPYPGPVGGPCLEKDPYILAEGFERHGRTPALALSGRAWNEGLPQRSVDMIAGDLRARGNPNPKRIAVMGVAFKGRPETGDLRGSLIYNILDALRAAFPQSEFVSWDPVVEASELAGLGLIPMPDAEAAFDGAGLVVLQNNHVDLERLAITKLSARMQSPGLIYDYWNQHRSVPPSEFAPGVQYRALGAFNFVAEED